jgi:hypothetical protein
LSSIAANLNDPREQFNLAEIATRASIGYNITDVKLDLLRCRTLAHNP